MTQYYSFIEVNFFGEVHLLKTIKSWMVEFFTGIRNNLTRYFTLVLVGTSEVCLAGISFLCSTDEELEISDKAGLKAPGFNFSVLACRSLDCIIPPRMANLLYPFFLQTKANLVTPRNGEPLIAAIQDFLTGGFVIFS